MNYEQFIAKYEGKATDIDGSAGVQCVDLAKAYMRDLFGVPFFSVGSAKNYFEKFDTYPELRGKFTKILNTPTFVPLKGDIAVWGSSKGKGHGHVAICTGEGNTRYFYSFDQNWNEKKCVKVYHDYKGFLGVLRPINRKPINDTTTAPKPSQTGVRYYPKYTGRSKSIADALNELGFDGSFSNRRKIAKANNIPSYIGSSKQNIQMFTLLKRGRLIRA